MNRFCTIAIMMMAILAIGATALGSPFQALQNNFPEPTGPELDAHNIGAFYDKTSLGEDRPVRNDLEGSLNAMIQFVQSLSINPSGELNKSLFLPNVTMSRAALLLVTPDPSMADSITTLTVTTMVNGVSKLLTMKHPNYIPRSDYTGRDTRPDYVYSRRAWSVELSWDVMMPGLSLTFTDNTARTGTLSAEFIDWEGPAEMVTSSIRLGLLTDAPPLGSDYYLLTDPEKSSADYFQTIPAAQFTVVEYEARTLRKVMVGSGQIYTERSSDEGGVYDGDMREDTAKSTVSTGINLANYGATSAGMKSQSQPQVFQTTVVHHAFGMYTNGIQMHGYSGGNGILTLEGSYGNEFSHEIGHHYGLGHYPGAVEYVDEQGIKQTDYFQSNHHHDSGWGYISYRNHMRANLHWSRAKTDRLNKTPVFNDQYSFTPDAMAGGSWDSTLSRYTHYTGYSTFNNIQPSLNARAVPSATSATGWSKWNGETSKMEDWNGNVSKDQYWNTKTGQYLKPREIGVPVWTILGGYDPLRGSAILYEPFRGSWGIVYDLEPRQLNVKDVRQCWLTVSFKNGSTKDISVSGTILQKGSVNKLHVNIAQSENPTYVQLKCQEPGQRMVSVLDGQTFAQNLPAQKPPVIVGRENGYKQLRNVEIVEYNAKLESFASADFLNFDSQTVILHNSWGLPGMDLTGLSDIAKTVRDRYITTNDNAKRINRWMNKYRTQLETPSNTAAMSAFMGLLNELDLVYDPLIPTPVQLKLIVGHCMRRSLDTTTGVWSVFLSPKAVCDTLPLPDTQDDSFWIIDGHGAIHSATNYELCLTMNKGAQLLECNNTLATQKFTAGAFGSIRTTNGSCLDWSGGYFTTDVGTIITYGCSSTGQNNQNWPAFAESPKTNALMVLLDPANLATLKKINFAEASVPA